MPKLIAFLRAINVAGRNVKMTELRSLFQALGFTDVETFIASGNVIFGARSGDTSSLERTIERHLNDSLGYEVNTFIRTDAEVASIRSHKPFTDSQLKSFAALNIAFVAEPLRASQKKALMRLKTDLDNFHVHGREVYWLCKKQSESTFSNAVLEKTLKIQATFRSAKTIAQLAARYPVARAASSRPRTV